MANQVRNRWRWRWAIDLAVVILVFLGAQWWLTRDVVRGSLPVLDAPLVAGTGADAATWRGSAGRNGYVLYVWATWCSVCKLIEGTVNQAARDLPILTVAMQSGSAEQVRRHLSARQHDWPTLNDPEGLLASRLGVDAVPTFIFVDRHGRVRSVTQGFTTGAGLRARMAWTRFVQG